MPSSRSSGEVFRKAVIAAKEKGLEATIVAEKFAKLLLSYDFEVVTVSPLRVNGVSQIQSLREFKATKSEVLVSVGGDGTLLKVVRESRTQSPVLGVNVGGRGALTKVDRCELEKAAKLLSEGGYTLETRMRLQASTSSQDFPPATNDILLLRIPLDRTPSFTIHAAPSLDIEHRMDGLIISTPLGSTGHSLSAGGPVLQESLDVCLLTPMAPLNGLPPIVLASSTFDVICNFPLHAVIDGQKVFKIVAKTQIHVRKAEQPVTFVKFHDSSSFRLTCLESKRR